MNTLPDLGLKDCPGGVGILIFDVDTDQYTTYVNVRKVPPKKVTHLGFHIGYSEEHAELKHRPVIDFSFPDAKETIELPPKVRGFIDAVSLINMKNESKHTWCRPAHAHTLRTHLSLAYEIMRDMGAEEIWLQDAANYVDREIVKNRSVKRRLSFSALTLLRDGEMLYEKYGFVPEATKPELRDIYVYNVSVLHSIPHTVVDEKFISHMHNPNPRPILGETIQLFYRREHMSMNLEQLDNFVTQILGFFRCYNHLKIYEKLCQGKDVDKNLFLKAVDTEAFLMYYKLDVKNPVTEKVKQRRLDTCLSVRKFDLISDADAIGGELEFLSRKSTTKNDMDVY